MRLRVGFEVGIEALRSIALEVTVAGVNDRRRSKGYNSSGSNVGILLRGVQLPTADSVDGAMVVVFVQEHG